MSAPSIHEILATYRGVRVLVLGASGFLGLWTARLLTRANADLHFAVRHPAHASPLLRRWQAHGEIHMVDAGNADQVRALLSHASPMITFNLVGYGVDRSERDEAIAECLNAGLPAVLTISIVPGVGSDWRGCALVHAGSALEYGEVSGGLAEDGPCQPTTLYGRTKLAGTRALADACLRRGLRGVVARLFTLYGPGEHEGRLLTSLVHAARGEDAIDLTGGAQRRDFTYVEDAAEGLLRLGVSAAGPGEIANLATGSLTRVRDFALIAAQELGLQRKRLRFGALPTRGEEMCHDPVQNERFRALTGWGPSADVHAGIRRALAARLILGDEA